MNTPKFKEGDWIKSKKDGRIARIVMLLETCYDLNIDGECWWLDYDYQDNWELTDEPPEKKLEEFVNDYLQEHRHDVLLNPYNGLIDFANAFKEQMMKEAVEGEVIRDYDWDTGTHRSIRFDISQDKYYEGEKVKVIIIKEDEK